MTKLYVINDTPLFGVSRKERRVAMRREQSGDQLRDGPLPLPPRDGAADNPIVEAILPSSATPRGVTAPTRSVWGMPAAYLLGPLLVARWTRGGARALWTTIGAASLVAATLLAARWTPFLGWAADTEHGSVAWLATLTTVCLAGFATWSRAIAAAAERHPAPLRPRFRDARVVLAVALAVPGLGHYLARRPRSAAAAFRLLGPFAAAVIVLANGRWLWAVHRAGSPGAMDPIALETVLATAAALSAALLCAWIGQAVQAARLVAPQLYGAWPGRLLIVSLVAAVLAVTLVAKEPVAGALHGLSARLHGKGLCLIPLGLSGTAARLDGSRPAYLVDVVALNEELGRTEAAREARDTLRARAAAFGSATRDAAIPVVLATGGGDGSAWARLQTLIAP